ncbi:hypothetical protein BAU06_21100 [Bordetella bronchialis]|uniref:Novel E3 ligase domain-containing protein n=2 Tax=Bordetella bronchialis TaxID=463025 RepID=A0ABM6CWF3_9BORD|nr:hypothetical protein BAU06_21100 [Bordetella bronchialis]
MAVWQLHDLAFDRDALEHLVLSVLHEADPAAAAQTHGASHRATNPGPHPGPHPPAPPSPAVDSLHTLLAELLESCPELPRQTPYPKARYGPIPDEVVHAIGGPALLAIVRPERAGALPPGALADIRDLWCQQVRYLEQEGEAVRSPVPSPALLRFIKSHLAKHPGLDQDAFFLPFRQLAERCMSVINPDGGAEALPCMLGQGLESGLIPYEEFRAWAQACARDVPPVTLAGFHEAPHRFGFGTPHAFWDVNLVALFSPLALGLLQHKRASLETLTAWLGVDARVQARGNARPPAPASRTAYLLASMAVNRACSRPGALANPEVIVRLAQAVVPVKHVNVLLGYAGSVGAQALEDEIARVIEGYRSLQAASAPATPSTSPDYSGFYLRVENWHPGSPKMARIQQSLQALMPHCRLEAARNHARLNRPVVAVSAAPAAGSPLRRTLQRADELFAAWRAEGMTADEQSRLSRVLMQGFDDAWARAAIFSGTVSPARVEAWFERAQPMDLGAFLDRSMKEATLRWLRDTEIDADLLWTVPAMILSRLDIDEIDAALRSESATLLPGLPVLFDPDTQIPLRVRYGVVSPDRLREAMRDRSTLFLAQNLKSAPLDPLAISPLRYALGDMLWRLRRGVVILDTVRGVLAPDSAGAARCARLERAWRDAIERLDALLCPAMEEALVRDPARMENELSRLRHDVRDAMPDVPGAHAGAHAWARA